MKKCLITTDIPGAVSKHQGKVRDIYDFGEHLLIATTDKISCFDVILLEGIPKKGKILNELSLFWFNLMGDKIPNHVVSTKPADFPDVVQEFLIQDGNQDLFRKRLVLVKKLRMKF